MLSNALWGLAMPTSLVSESEQGQLQGANGSVASVAGVFSPMVFGAVYSMSVSFSLRADRSIRALTPNETARVRRES